VNTALSARIISDFALEQLAVRENDLLSRVASHPCRLQPDVLDLAAVILNRDRVSDNERLVYNDGDRGKEIGQRCLDSESDRESADTKSGEQRPDRNTERP